MGKSIGKGAVLKLNGTTVAHLTSIDGPSRSVETVDSTDTLSTAREFLPGYCDNGEVSFSGHYDASSHGSLESLIAAPAVESWSIVLADTDGTTFTFDGILTAWGIAGGATADMVTYDGTIKVSGDVTIS